MAAAAAAAERNSEDPPFHKLTSSVALEPSQVFIYYPLWPPSRIKADFLSDGGAEPRPRLQVPNWLQRLVKVDDGVER